MLPSVSDKVHECQTCGKTFKRRSYLQLHEKIHGEKCYKCNICEKSFRQPAGLWIHKKHQSCLKRNSPSNTHTSSCKASERINDRTSPDDDGGKRHKCDICDRRFSQKHLLSYHKRTHTGENPYPCTVCGKMFRGTATLKYHERTHTGYKPYKCIFCDKAFAQLGPLRLHCRKEHQSEKVYECDICKEQFEKFKQLSCHQKTHSEIISQKKSLCATVQREASLEQRHDEVTLVNCETRSNSLSRKCLVSEVDEDEKDVSMNKDNVGDLSCNKKRKINEIHGRDRSKNSTYEIPMTHHTVTSDAESKSSCTSANDKLPEFKSSADTNVSSPEDQVTAQQVKQESENPCVNGNKYNICNQEFSPPHVLKHDKRTHSEENTHPCSVCGKTFRSQGALTVHQRIHNGLKPYKCIYCSHCFTQRSTLLQHCKRIHLSDEIYECTVCKEKFEKYRDLTLHSQVHSDAPCTMVKQIRDQVNFTLEEDELKPLKQLEKTTSDYFPSPSPSDAKNEDINCDKENPESAERSSNCSHDDDEKHSVTRPTSTEEQTGYADISSSGECLRVVHHVKKEKEDYDSSNDSGISPDTSPLDVNVESDSIYEVYMQPIEMDCERKNRLSVIRNKLLQTTGNLTISPQECQTCPTDVVDECSKAVSNDDQLSNCSRVTTPDNDYIFSSCCSDIQQNSSWEKKCERSTYSQALHGNKKWQENSSIDTMNYPLLDNNDFPSNSVYNTVDFQLSTTEIDFIQELSGRANLMPFHSQVFNNNETTMHSDIKHGSSVCESEASNFPKHFNDGKRSTKMNMVTCSHNFIRMQNDKMYPLLSHSDLNHCGCRNKTCIALKDPQQNPKCEYEENVMKQICFQCDVLPSSCHLGK